MEFHYYYNQKPLRQMIAKVINEKKINDNNFSNKQLFKQLWRNKEYVRQGVDSSYLISSKSCSFLIDSGEW